MNRTRNLVFVIWMVGAPIVGALDQYVNKYLCKNTYSTTVEGLAALISLVVYFFIGYKLYEEPEPANKAVE